MKQNPMKKLLELSERQKKDYTLFKKNGKITLSICTNILAAFKAIAVRGLSELISKNIIKREGIGRGIYLFFL